MKNNDEIERAELRRMEWALSMPDGSFLYGRAAADERRRRERDQETQRVADAVYKHAGD